MISCDSLSPSESLTTNVKLPRQLISASIYSQCDRRRLDQNLYTIIRTVTVKVRVFGLFDCLSLGVECGTDVDHRRPLLDL